MKELTTYNRTVQYMNKVFKLINSDYFDGELEMPTITIQSTVGAYGHVTTSKVWKNERGNASYELNIGADYLSRPIENIVATLIHEGCHLYAMQKGIKDTSNRGIYHNRRFKELAEARGLDISRHERYGWTITEPTDATLDFCIANDLQDVMITRQSAIRFTGVGTPKAGNGGIERPVAPKKGNSIKWVCPDCGAIVRSTKIVNIMCGDCNKPFVRV
ncbi:MAG: SprT-like domain-containing protein [Eubacteriales bacterium]|nr:SprT-like domain-containing protein [Eubacteriales bacterium]